LLQYGFPRPRECLRCGGKCYAYGLYDSTTTGREYPEGVYKCYWACNVCNSRFQTFERERDFVIVDKLPDDYNAIKGIAYVTMLEEVEVA